MRDDKATKVEFAAVLNGVMVGIYAKPELQREALAMWFMALERFDLADVRAALSRHVGDADRGQYPPRPADVVRQIEGGAIGAATLAWGKVLKAISSVGQYSTVCFDEPAINAAISDLGGWPQLCATRTDEIPFVQRRFEASYRAYRDRGNSDYPRQLAGTHETHNRAHGYLTGSSVPTLIGDPDKCALVFERGTSGGLQITSGQSVGNVVSMIGQTLAKRKLIA